MAILHGNWLTPAQVSPVASPFRGLDDSSSGYFFLWGEVWRRIDPLNPGTDSPTLPHPFVMSARELLDSLNTLHQAQRLTWAIAELPLAASAQSQHSNKKASSSNFEPPSSRWQTVYLSLPTYRLQHPDIGDGWIPQHSAAVVTNDEQPSTDLEFVTWQVSGLALTPLEALHFLNSLPLSSFAEEDSFVAGDLRFWSHVARWCLDLLARSKFVPGFARLTEESGIAYWQALIDSDVDQTRLQHFSKQMPQVCRAYQCWLDEPGAPVASRAELRSPRSASKLLLSFLNQVADMQVRAAVGDQPLPAMQLPKDIPLREWLQDLCTAPQLSTETTRLERLEAVLGNWLAPLERQLSQQFTAFRTCLWLKPPPPNQSRNWSLEFGLQASDDPDFFVPAEVIWGHPVEQLSYQGRTLEQPQETLLAGLGLASRLYPVIEPSLQDANPVSASLDPSQVYEFLKGTAWRLQDSGFGVILPPSLANQDGWANRLGLSITAEPPSRRKGQRLGLQSLLNFKWELTIGGQRISKREFDRLVAQNTPLVEINGEWVELRPQDVRSAQSFFDSRKDQMTLSLEDALRISTGDTQTIERLPVLNFEASGSLQELISALTTGNQAIETIPTPDGFQGELRPYQLRGASWMVFLEKWGLGACLADDMGLGKTIQFIALMLHLREQGVLDKPTLLVCPTSVLGNWEREVRRFGPKLKVLVHHGDRRPQGKAFVAAANDHHLVITSYALVYRDEKDLKRVSWQGVVLDEAQNIKNAESKQSQAVRQLEAEFRIALTGTPVENRLTELWSIMDFLNPGYLGPRNFFQRRFAVPIERYGDTASLKTLRSLVQPFILRRLKTDRSIIQDLPEKQEMTVFCGLSTEQASLYQSVVERALADIDSVEGIQRKGMILALLVKLKQICNHPELFEYSSHDKDDNSALSAAIATHPQVFEYQSGKLQRLTEMLEEVLAEGDRSLIFTQFAEWGKLLKTYLEQQFKREVLFLYGGTSKKQREAMVDRFQNDPQSPRVFILSLKAGGVGLNLTRANRVFHFDRWWNPAVENQATDRVFRIGQTRNVQVHKFVCTGTLEERIHELIESKKALSEQVVGAGENWLTELDTDQLRNLLLLDRAAVIDDADG